MKYSEMRGHLADRTTKGNLRKRAREALATVAVPHATPARPPTGERGDFQGNTYTMHSGKPAALREARRGSKSGRFGVQPLRSRIQRQTRRQRTGGVK